MSKAGAAPDWLRLQRLIFSRWVNQKLSLTRGIFCQDVVTELGSGELLLNLVEVLSEKNFPEKITKAPKQRVQKLDNVTRILKWALGPEVGISMKVPPSAENLVDANEKETLGLVWAIMLKFLKFSDDDDEEAGTKALNAKESLLAWVQNKLQGYGLEVKGFGKDFHDGRAFCALLHKHRPRLLDWESVNASNASGNINKYFEAAHKYFGYEAYLTPEDVPKLDENSMFVVVSDLYYGIAEQRKLDLASRRLHKLIAFTVENDALRKEYNETAAKLTVHLAKVEAVLGDRTIDNTLAGAQARLQAFYDFKTNDKSVILSDVLNLESLYSNLQTRLTSHKRPQFVPAAGCALADIRKRLHSLEVAESERKVALHNELNRQLRLVSLNARHESRHSKLAAWIADKDAYTAHVEAIGSVGDAQFALKLLEAFFKEDSQTKETSVASLSKIGAVLLSEHYEHSDAVKERESEVTAGLAKIDGQAATKKERLEKALALEIRKEELRQSFADLAAEYVRWTANGEANLESFFGFSLEDVEAFGSSLTQTDNKLLGVAQTRHDAAAAVFAEAESIGVTENRYTKLGVGDLTNSLNALRAAIAQRRSAYDAELARQRKIDDLARRLAALADPYSKSINDNKDRISNSSESLEVQLAFVEQQLSALATNPLHEIDSLQAQLDAEQAVNKYTLLTAKDVRAQHDQYGVFLNRKADIVRKEIEAERLKGLSAEDAKEIESNFGQFDKDADGSINRRELKALLYSLGEEKSKAQIAEILSKYGDAKGNTSFASFRELMIAQLGDADTVEETLNGFRLINKGHEHATKERLEFVLEPEDAKYIQETAPKSADGWDTKAWTKDVYSR